MKDIDFLPSRYRERTQMRRMMVWRCSALAVLGVIMATSHIAQSTIDRNASRQLASIEASYIHAISSRSRLETLRKELVQAEQLAELYVYLRHPWPRTQILAAIAQTLPRQLTLTELQITDQQSATSASAAARPSAEENVAPAKKDLNTIRTQNERGICVVTIHGTTSDISALQTYVAGFATSPYFSGAKLESLESLKGNGRTSESRFELRLETRPCYGHPGGPAKSDRLTTMRNPIDSIAIQEIRP